MRILLAEDDLLLGDGIRAGLRLEGDTVEWVTDGVAAENALVTDEFDLLVLDIGLPRRSGLDILRNLRHQGRLTPVLLLTARDKVADRVAGLDSGADDYLTKPFYLDELQARVRALTRRTTGRALPQLVHGELRLDPATHQVTLSGQAVELAPREYALLRLLLENSGKVLSRNQLEQSLYGWSGDVESNAIEVHVHHLRRKLGNQLIRTVRGIGYGIDQPAALKTAYRSPPMSRAAVPSVRRRLLVNLLVGFVLCWLSVAALTYHLSLKQVNRLFDDDMVDFGEAALRLLDLATEDQAGEDGSITEIIERSREAIQGLPLLRRESALGYALWRDGQPLLSSLNLPPEITAQGPGFSTVEAQGTHWRVLQLNIDGFQIWISENLIYRQHTMNLLLFYSLFPLLLALPLLGGLVWFGVARGLAPLREVQAEVQQRSARHLQPIAVEAVPLEIRGLIDELNLLLERLRTALEAERRLTSDAAHEIRTPLASLRTHAQVALRSEDPKAHARGLLQVSRSVERISTLMEQILLLARLDGDALLEQFHPVNLATLAEDVLSELARQAIDKDIELSLHQETVHVMGIDLWLKAMVGNLVGNALRYTPAGGQVEIRVENRAQHAVLRVRDNGPGVALEEQQAIFTRFYRSPATSSGEGSGLGLPIVKRIVELHFGSIGLGKGLEGKGLEVQVFLPKTQPDATRPPARGPDSGRSHI